MRRLLLLRHAKSSWKEEGRSDHDRPLNRRGHRDAPVMGALLARQAIVPDRIVSSTALRARTTAEEVAQAAGFDGETQQDPRLYLADPETILEVVRECPDDAETVLVVAHNPGMQSLAVLLARSPEPEPFPTAALAQIDVQVDTWRRCRLGVPARLAGLWRPKELPADG